MGTWKEPLFHGQIPVRVELPQTIPRGEQRADPDDPFKDVKSKRFDMRLEYLDKFGLTPGCNGCLALMT